MCISELTNHNQTIPQGWRNKTDGEGIYVDFFAAGLKIKTKPSISNFSRVAISFGSLEEDGYIGGFTWTSTHITSIYIRSEDHICDKAGMFSKLYMHYLF